MPDIGIILSDERTKTLMKRLEETYTEAYKTAVKNNEKTIKKYASLTDKALKNLTPEQRKLKREAFAREVKRTEDLSKRIGREVANAGQTADNIIQGEMANIYGLNYDYAAFSVQRQAGVVIDFTVYDRNQIAVLMQEQQSPFTKLAYKKLGQDAVIVERLQNQFTQGILNGESQQKLIRRIRTVTGQSVSQAKRVAQTERTRVQSQGRQMGFDEAETLGVEMDKQWVARMINTRDTHAAINQQIVANDETFGNGLEYPGDPSGGPKEVCNCFCYLKPMVQSTSPALAKHREWAREKSFEKYQEEQEDKRKTMSPEERTRVAKQAGVKGNITKLNNKKADETDKAKIKEINSKIKEQKVKLKELKKPQDAVFIDVTGINASKIDTPSTYKAEQIRK